MGGWLAYAETEQLIMLFSLESAIRELKRLNDNGGEGMYMLKKRWYGWIIVDNPLWEAKP